MTYLVGFIVGGVIGFLTIFGILSIIMFREFIRK
jgi:hypothetical protein